MRKLEQIHFFENMVSMTRDQQFSVCKRIAESPYLSGCARAIVERVAKEAQFPRLLKLIEVAV